MQNGSCYRCWLENEELSTNRERVGVANSTRTMCGQIQIQNRKTVDCAILDYIADHYASTKNQICTEKVNIILQKYARGSREAGNLECTSGAVSVEKQTSRRAKAYLGLDIKVSFTESIP